jgi:hypothetical protein
MSKLTNQECFNKVWDWFVVNKNPQSIKDNVCQYRGPNGAKCAAGVLMPDENYSVEFEGCSIGGINICLNGFFNNLVQDVSFIKQMQDVHDAWISIRRDGEFLDYMTTKLTKLAQEHNLQIPA